jgi:hypothetical protein
MATYPTPASLFNVFSDIREFLVAGFRAFPTAFAGTALFLGLFTGHYAMLFFLIGLLVFTPFINFFLTTLLPASWGSPTQGAVCNLVLKNEQVGTGVASAASQQFLSDWSAMAIFIFSYLGANAYALYNIPVQYAANATADDKAATDEKAGLRKSRAIISLIMILATALVFFILRYFVSGCDGMIGLLVGFGIFGSFGAGWYHILRGVGQDRLSDLFGVANRLLSPTALTDQPFVCLPQASRS